MKIEYEISDKDFETLFAALNNGFISLQNTYFALNLRCQVPTAFERMQDTYSLKELDDMSTEKLRAFLDFYNYLDSFRKKTETGSLDVVGNISDF